MDDTLYDFDIGNGITVNTIGNEVLELQANGRHEDSERIADSASRNQVLGSNFDDRIRDAVHSAVITVDNHMQDAILTPMNNIVIPRVEMAVRWISGASGNEPNSIV